MSGSWTTRFRASGGEIVMEFETTIEPGGIKGVFAPLIKPWAGRQLTCGLASCKRWVEVGGC